MSAKKNLKEQMSFNWRFCVNKAMLAHNSQELQDKLLALGYYPLGWTVSEEEVQKLIISPFTYTDCASYSKLRNYPGCFWNGGVTPIENRDDVGVRGDCYYCGDDEELFLKWAERLMAEKEVYFDKDKNELNV